MIKKVILKTEKKQPILVLPEEFHLEGEEFYIKQVDNTIVLFSGDNPYRPLWDSLELFSENFLDERQQPPDERREDLFE